MSRKHQARLEVIPLSTTTHRKGKRHLALLNAFSPSVLLLFLKLHLVLLLCQIHLMLLMLQQMMTMVVVMVVVVVTTVISSDGGNDSNGDDDSDDDANYIIDDETGVTPIVCMVNFVSQRKC